MREEAAAAILSVPSSHSKVTSKLGLKSMHVQRVHLICLDREYLNDGKLRLKMAPTNVG